MGDIQTRPFSKNYSGLINQSVIGIGITVLCVTGQELMKRRRRGKVLDERCLGSRESWEFGYLYQGRCWARFPSPPTPKGWPLSWVKQAIQFPEDKLNQLRGLDATLYIRFLRGCFWFTLLHTLTTFPILFPIHVEFSGDDVPPRSMTRASISSLVGTAKGLSLLWIHICLLIWITLSWMATLFWICTGAFRLRAAGIEVAARRLAMADDRDVDDTNYQHPHPQYGFIDVPSSKHEHRSTGLRLRTIMVSNVPQQLRNEKELKEYFEFWMCRKVEKPSMGLTASTHPGFLNKSLAFLFNRAKRLPAHLPANPLSLHSAKEGNLDDGHLSRKSTSTPENNLQMPDIERVVVVRKMTELASLLERREETLRLLETAHIKLANKTLLAVKMAMERRANNRSIPQSVSKRAELARKERKSVAIDAELGGPQEGTLDEEERMNQLLEVLGPYVEAFDLQHPLSHRSKKAIRRTSRRAFHILRAQGSEESGDSDAFRQNTNQLYPPKFSTNRPLGHEETIWDALLSLPRSSLDAYQPLINLSHLFHGKTVPAIDYYTAKLNLLTSMITENRSKAATDFDPVSTAFVTFADPEDARRACKYLAVHPKNPLDCLVTMAPMYEDLDWMRVMKSSFNAEFLKDWVVNIGVWAFTFFWLFPVSLLVGLVSIQNISLFWPGLKRYLDRHQWEEEVIQSFIPTLLVALLALLIPLILLLIAKKVHTITTLSALHDQMMTRYYKFLIVNVLVFFCVGTAVLQSFLQSFRSINQPNLLHVVADSFPTAGPFYVGWLLFTTAMHGGFELALFGLPLILYPSTSRQVTPRKRAVGIRPRTFNFYYWLPNHLLVIHVLLLFSVLNPFVLPFGTLYFFVQSGVVKNQLIHVYAKNYEGNGQLLLIRIVRYSLDGLVLSQAVFLAYMVVLKKDANVAVAACLIVLTVLFKLLMTRMCRAQFEADDIAEAAVLCNRSPVDIRNEADQDSDEAANVNEQEANRLIKFSRRDNSVLTWKLPAWVNFSYKTMHRRPQFPQQRPPNPFRPQNQTLLPRDSSSRNHVTEECREGPSTHISPDDAFPWEKPTSQSRDDTKVKQINATLTDISGPVISRPPPIPWDDQENVDLPYDNPFYTRTIDNSLWLPRDPTGILDLDDTVDLKKSITVEVSAGALGTWLGLAETSSPAELSDTWRPKTLTPEDRPTLTPRMPSSPRTPQSLLQRRTSLPVIDGTEEIDLPIVIAKRVQAKEEGVEQTLRPRKSSIYHRKGNVTDKSSIASTPGRRRPSLLDLPTTTIGSDGNIGRARSGSTLSALQIPGLHRTLTSANTEFGERPDAHAQADFVAANGSASRISLAPPKATRSGNLSTQQAIFHELLAEEQQEFQDRVEAEQVETIKATTNKSWLTSWMFKKAKREESPGDEPGSE